MKGLGRVFQAKGLARPRPEVGKSLSSSRNRKAASVNSIWAEGRMMGRGWMSGAGERSGGFLPREATGG